MSYDLSEKNGVEPTLGPVQTASDHEYPKNTWSQTLKNVFLAKVPLEDAPLVTAGHRTTQEPEKLSPWGVLLKFATFIGPGLILAIPYADPDGYTGAIGNGEDFQYKQLDIVLVSILIGIFFQYLALKVGTVNGLDLAQMNHKHLPRWLEMFLYVMAETVIIVTDVSAVIGAAWAWNVLIPRLPLAAACVVTTVDCIIILIFYSPYGTLRSIRAFELFMAGIALAMMITCAIALSQVSAPAGPVFKGFLPSREIFVSQGLYSTCASIGGILVPAGLYVGSSLGRPRLLAYDEKNDLTTYKPGKEGLEVYYRPSLRAIKSTLGYASWEVGIAIFVVGIFINSALTIVGGSALFGTDFDTPIDLNTLLVQNISQLAATAFAVSLLFSGIGAGIVSTMAGQTVMEGAFQIKINPIIRRFITRLIAIIPALVICVSVGDSGIDNALAAINYIEAIGIVFLIAPLLWYVTHDKYMSVPNDDGTGTVSLSFGLVSSCIAWFVWAVVTFTSIATIVLLGLGLSDG